jgi:hypothetical protein
MNVIELCDGTSNLQCKGPAMPKPITGRDNKILSTTAHAIHIYVIVPFQIDLPIKALIKIICEYLVSPIMYIILL